MIGWLIENIYEKHDHENTIDIQNKILNKHLTYLDLIFKSLQLGTTAAALAAESVARTMYFKFQHWYSI